MDSVARVAVLSLLSALVGAITDDPGTYYIGVGRADVTGPAAEVEMVSVRQLHVFSRSFILSMCECRWAMLVLHRPLKVSISDNGAEHSS